MFIELLNHDKTHPKWWYLHTQYLKDRIPVQTAGYKFVSHGHGFLQEQSVKPTYLRWNSSSPCWALSIQSFYPRNRAGFKERLVNLPMFYPAKELGRPFLPNGYARLIGFIRHLGLPFKSPSMHSCPNISLSWATSRWTSSSLLADDPFTPCIGWFLKSALDGKSAFATGIRVFQVIFPPCTSSYLIDVWSMIWIQSLISVDNNRYEVLKRRLITNSQPIRVAQPLFALRVRKDTQVRYRQYYIRYAKARTY